MAAKRPTQSWQHRARRLVSSRSSLRARWAQRLAVALLASASLSLQPSTTTAMTVLKASLPDLVGTSELVLHARVHSVKVHDRRAIGRAVWTRYELDVIEVYKGDRKVVGPRFGFELLGGSTADGMTLSVPGMPGFTASEEVVVLLERHAEGFTLTGAPQGKWTIYRDAKKVARVVRDTDHAHIVERAKSGALVAAEHGKAPMVLQPPAADRTLASLRAEILSIVTASAKVSAPRRMVRPAAGTSRP